MNVVGIDLALGATGLVDQTGTTFQISPRTKSRDRYDRILDVSGRILELVGRPELVVLEGYGAAGPGRASMIAGIEVGAAIRLELRRLDVCFLDVAPTTLKAYATGNGRAEKRALRAELGRWWLVEELPGRDLSSDEIDALWLRDVGLWLLGEPSAGPHPDTKPAVVDGILERARPVLSSAGLETRDHR